MISPSSIVAYRLSRVTFLTAFASSKRFNSWRFEEIARASFSVSVTWNGSPAFGIASKPRISTGILGVASVIFCPLSLKIARTRPE